MRNTSIFKKKDKIIHFLMKFNEHYQNVRSQVLLIETLPTNNKVISMVLQEERQHNYGASAYSKVKNEET